MKNYQCQQKNADKRPYEAEVVITGCKSPYEEHRCENAQIHKREFTASYPEKAEEAANALKLTAQDLMKFGVIDEIVEEPIGGAHRDPKSVIDQVGESLESALAEMQTISDLRDHRNQKFLDIGRVVEQ